VRIAPVSKIVFIEKPGVINRNEWAKLCKRFPRTRFMMVKNNMWRDNIPELQQKASAAKNVDVEWIRRNCIPSPGSWFTTRKLAFGGVSRDLMPHLLSLYIALNPEWRTERINGQAALQNWLLEDIESTEYGTVQPNGTYDVDDQCNIHFGNKWNLRANWRSVDSERSAITFVNQDNSKDVFELGWCPEEAYLNMIKDAIENLNNDEYWKVQLEIDLWIHERIENL
jgi:predicted dehydrogenase